jgi:hypothetical protein
LNFGGPVALDGLVFVFKSDDHSGRFVESVMGVYYMERTGNFSRRS